MSTNANPNELDRVTDDRDGPAVPAVVEATESYQTDDGTVFYHAENPMAWIQATEPVRLADVT